MAGKITVSTINDSSGVLATQNGMTGIAKAWCVYNGSTQAISSSFNISSVTYNSTGNYTFNFTTAMASANYSSVASADAIAITNNTAPTSSALNVQIYTRSNPLTAANSPYCSIAIFAS